MSEEGARREIKGGSGEGEGEGLMPQARFKAIRIINSVKRPLIYCDMRSYRGSSQGQSQPGATVGRGF